MLHKGDEPIPGYRLERFLGRGQYGEVWQASAPGRTRAALKFIDLSGKQGAKELRGVTHVKEIRHAHLMPITALWMLDEDGNILADESFADFEPAKTVRKPSAKATLVVDESRPMMLVVGMLLGNMSLQDRLEAEQQKGNPGIPVAELLRYMEEAAKGIDFLNTHEHDLGDGFVTIQHCDIKPANIMLVGDSVLICDFGLARMLGDSARATATGMVGSPAYMAPECIRRKPSHASDQYSLAVTYVELRTGRLPFDTDSYMEVLEAHEKGTLQLEALSSFEQNVIRKATSIEPNDRYPTSYEMVHALRIALAKQVGDPDSATIPFDVNSPIRQTEVVQATARDVKAGRATVRADRPAAKPRAERKPRFFSRLAAFTLLLAILGAAAAALHAPTRARLLALLPVAETVEEVVVPDTAEQDQETSEAMADPVPAKPDGDNSKTPQEQDDEAEVAEMPDVVPQIAQLLKQAEGLLANDDWEEAKRCYEEALALLDTIPPADAPEPRREARLGLLRIRARQPDVNWSDLLLKLDETVQDGEGEESHRVHCLALRVLGRAHSAQDDVAFRDSVLLTDLAKLVALSSHLDPWERHEVDSLKGSLLKELQALPELDEATLQLVPQIWPGGADDGMLLTQKIVAGLSDPATSHEELLKDCERLRAMDGTNPLVNMCWVECQIALADSGASLDRKAWFSIGQLTDATLKAIEQDSSMPHADYLRFVAALVQHASPLLQRSDVAVELIQTARSNPSPVLETTWRRSKASEILTAAAARLGVPTDVELMTDEVAARDSLETAYEYLTAASELEVTPSTDLRVGLALAAAFRPGADAKSWEASRRLSDALLADESLQEVLRQKQVLGQLRLVNAKAHERRFHEQGDVSELAHAVRQYAAVLELLEEARRAGQPLKDVAVYQRIAAPAFALAAAVDSDEVPAEFAVPLAALYAARGRMILRDHAVKKLFDKEGEPHSGNQTAYDSFRRAAELDPRADYLVGRGRALIVLPQDDRQAKLDELNQLASAALEAEPSHPGAHALNGYTQIMSSRRTVDWDERRELLSEAVNAYARAIELSSESDSYRTTYYEDLSAAHLEFAYFSADNEEKRLHLDEAESNARKSLAVAVRQRPENAFNNLGNALEDRAFYLKELNQYEAAIEAFMNGLGAASNSLRPTAPSAFAAGRARFRRVKYGQLAESQKDQELERALAMMKEALTEWSSLPPRRETQAKVAEVHIFVSDIYRYQADRAGKAGQKEMMLSLYDEADRERGRGAVLALEAKSLWWPKYQLEWSELATELANVHKREPAKRDEHLQASADRARQVLEKASEDSLGFSIRSDYLLHAIRYVFNASPELADRVQLVEDNIERFPDDHGENSRRRAQLLLSRAANIAQVPQGGESEWDGFKATATADATSALAIAEQLTDREAARKLKAQALAKLGEIEYRKSSDRRAGPEREQFARSAHDHLNQAIESFGDDIEESVLARWTMAKNCADRYKRANSAANNETAGLLEEGLRALMPIKEEHTRQYGGLYALIDKLRAQFKSNVP